MYNRGDVIPSITDVEQFEMLMVIKGSLALKLKDRNQCDASHQKADPGNAADPTQQTSKELVDHQSSQQSSMSKLMSSRFTLAQPAPLLVDCDAFHLVKDFQYVDSQLFKRKKKYKFFPTNSKELIQQVIREATRKRTGLVTGKSLDPKKRGDEENELFGRILYKITC